MEPKKIEKGVLIIVGVTGSGDETGKAWEAFMKLDKLNPLKNKVGEEGYEIRMYHGEGPGEVQVGVQVKDARVPPEYKVISLPASQYAEFEIYPAKGWESSNAEINNWLSENTGFYQQSRLGDKTYAVEVYDKRYKGDKDPTSVLGILIPIINIDGATMAKKIAGQIEEIGGQIEQYLGAEARKKVMKGSNDILAAGDPVKGARWVKEAMDRLDTLTDKKTREQIMSACGRNCHSIHQKDTKELRDMRLNYSTEEEFLVECIMHTPSDVGTRFERDGNVLIQYYTPRQYGKGMRCYCYLIGGLPAGETASPTYCQCSRGFVEKHWEYILGRPLKVELGETAITGAEECKFIIHL